MSTRFQRIAHTKIEAAAAEWIGRRDAGLTPAEQREFDQWRDAHALHREALARLESTWTALAAPFASGSAASLRRELEVVRRQRRLRTLKATAAILLCLAGGWALHTRRSPAEPTAVVWTPERRTLPDGSMAELPQGSEIAVVFSAQERRVVLKRGEAHFQVVPDPARPFRVLAGQAEFRAVGTAFAVQLADSVVDLIVTEGRVAVGPTPDIPVSDDSSPALVVAGQRVTLDAAATGAPEILAITEAEIADRLSWRNPRVEFSKAPLSEVVALLNRHTPNRFVIADPALGATALSGVFWLNDTETFLRMLEKGFGVSAKRQDQSILLRKAE
jgi:transmembrane sensor